ncbi:MAG: conjugal transfer protein TraX [Oscillospiraceae bacterium]|nr:conjugal transfer protein TraX [Oscillospiraceae bacterium]
MNKTKFGLTATHLRILALVLMLLDHLWATVVPGNNWMTYLGRMAFPIFAFQTAEGYIHTRDFNAYCKRLLIFAAVSELPFNLMISSSPIFPFHQNVMLTLLLGLLACRAYDRKRWGSVAGWIVLGAVTFCDYGSLGVVSVLMFHIFREYPLGQLLMLIAINGFGYEGQQLLLGRMEIPVQAFAILAFIPICLYSGEKGKGGKWLQYGSYIFYPAHMLILWLL